MRAAQSTPSKILYVKAPYLRQLRKHITPYLIRVEDLVHTKLTTIYVADGRQTLSCLVKDVVRIPIDKVPWVVLDANGYKSREQLIGNMREMTKLPTLNEVSVLELAVQ